MEKDIIVFNLINHFFKIGERAGRYALMETDITYADGSPGV